MVSDEVIKLSAPRPAKLVRLVLVIVAIALPIAALIVAEASAADCSAPPADPALELVFRLQGVEAEPAVARDEAVDILCERLRAYELDGQVGPQGETEIRVVLPRLPDVVLRRVIELIGARGQVLFYDWEANLIGPELLIGGRPGYQPPARALRRAEREWRAVGRDPGRLLNQQLIRAGAFPNLYGAVTLASRQRPRERCETCSTATPRFYLFDRSRRHRLLAGPVSDRAALRALDARRPGPGVILRVPVGTAIAREHPADGRGFVQRGTAPGWFALRDRPALSGADIVDPSHGYGLYDVPVVTFGFTPEGRVAFQLLTRAIAQRGAIAAFGPVTGERAEALSGHFAIVVDGEVRTRPVVNFAENPGGIDGRTGAQIAGGFNNLKEARELAASLRIGALPAEIELVRLSRF